ncbi:hypothetical protein [Aliikangiella maris]|uniref:Chromosomal replication initiator DnaA C-terminal domain-containing protein n=1 Tax=Aliikangiella maris TaxID=3162458 RepID=A0ABV3MV65_9GAMM
MLEIIADFYKVEIDSISNRDIGQKNSNPIRKSAMYICQQLGGFSLKEISSRFGLTHIGSVSFATTTVRKEMKNNKVFQRKMNRLKKHIIEKVN